MRMKKKKKVVHQVTLTTIVWLSYQEHMWQKKRHVGCGLATGGSSVAPGTKQNILWGPLVSEVTWNSC